MIIEGLSHGAERDDTAYGSRLARKRLAGTTVVGISSSADVL
jgi:hypothetical protein